MAKDPAFLRKRFLKFVEKHWCMNNHNLDDIPCVYVIVSYDFHYNQKSNDIVYVGSTTKLNSRYKSHRIPSLIQKSGNYSIMYYLPMSKGFYDYEIKMIKSLQTLYNKHHKNES